MKFKTYLTLLINSLMVIYILIVIFFTFLGGVLQYEFQIDGNEIKNVCDVLRSFVIDDIRCLIAGVSLFAIAPVLYYCFRRKFKNIIINVMLILFSLAWLWSYIIKYRNCLEFYIYPTSS
jgi:hypothetical protein